jgi:hypothetical protein
MELIPLTQNYELTAFDCGDDDLNAFRYITVDAYLSAIPFYEKNGFVHLTKKEEDEHTRLMFFDMMDIEE